MKRQFWKIVFSVISFLVCQKISIASDTSSVKYFPLETGNMYVYKHSYQGADTAYIEYVRANVIRDSVIGGRKYFRCSNFPFSRTLQTLWLRTDTITGSLYRYNPIDYCNQYYFNEDIVDTIGGSYGDRLRDCHLSTPIEVNFVGTDSIFGDRYVKKNFNFQFGGQFFVTETNKFYYKYIGLAGYHYYYHFFGSPTTNDVYTLVGCIVNGMKYGDTNTVAIHNLSEEVPIKFQVYQNYPNPFNPTTRIKFEIPKTSLLTLKIFNSIGQCVSTLVDQELNAGIYEVIFDGSSYSSGIYYYTIKSNEVIETKKMILLK